MPKTCGNSKAQKQNTNQHNGSGLILPNKYLTGKDQSFTNETCQTHHPGSSAGRKKGIQYSSYCQRSEQVLSQSLPEFKTRSTG
mmetsp:Transcript_31267/g.60940  ORF Transcript_31267/g.60940 Transcript_31267/m.60940 type:complete len:84 (+) Transcript_31267:1238-1489(+)